MKIAAFVSLKVVSRTPVLRYAEEPDSFDDESGSSAYLRTGVCINSHSKTNNWFHAQLWLNSSVMRIDEILGKGQPTVSFEFFPPKTDAGFTSLFQTIDELKSIKPSYVSVTYGAGGSTREKTVLLVERIQRELGIRSMAHLTCVGHTANELGEILDDLWKAGVRNVLALRGDPPAGQAQFTTTEGGFSNADGLVKFVASRHPFSIGVAGYPEGHPQCLNLTRDLEYLKAKVDNGATFIVTQLFFDNADFYRFPRSRPGRWASTCRSLPASCRF